MRKQRTSHRFRIYRAVRRVLMRRYPRAFPGRGRRPPLKVGILRDIVHRGHPGVSASQVRIFLQVWTSSTAYLASVAMGGPRTDLDGAPAGMVDDSHAREARERVAARRRERAARLTPKASKDTQSVNDTRIGR
jgi:Activator of osmoprotectant transporter ProP